METPQKEDDSSEQDEQRARDHDDEESAPNYSPLDISPFCYFFHQLVKSLLNCFGHGVGDDNINPDNIQEYSEAQMKVNEDRGISAASLRTVSRRPRRPPRSGLSTGSGGQTN